MMVMLTACNLVPVPSAPDPVVTDIRIEPSPVIYVDVGETEPAPSPTARWDEAEQAWVDQTTWLVIELEPAEHTVGYALWQHGELVSSGTADRLTEASVDLGTLPDPSGGGLVLRTYRHDGGAAVLHENPRQAGLSAPVPINLPD